MGLLDVVIREIRKGSVYIPPVELEDESDENTVYDGRFSGEKTIEVIGVQIVYHVLASKSGCWSRRHGWELNEPTVSTGIIRVYDVDGGEILLSRVRKEALEELLDEKTRV